MKRNVEAIIVIVLILLFAVHTATSQRIEGRVYVDKNENGVLDKGEIGLKGVLISNGIDIVKTDGQGYYELNQLGHTPIFMIKPSGYRSTVLHLDQPSFYENPNNRKGNQILFGVHRQEESSKTRIVLLGDTQPHNMDEIYYVLRTAIDEIKVEDFDFSIVLGDIVSDNPVVFPLLKEVISTTGRPSYYTFGNHDLDWEFHHPGAEKDWDVDFIKNLGPTHYALGWGNTNLLTINNINVLGKAKGYDYTIREGQLRFIENYLSHLKKDDLLVVTAHGSPNRIDNKQEFYQLFKGFTHVLFVHGHHHKTENYFLGKEEGWPNETPAQCIDVGAVCGGHWRGEEDMFWIPSATMVDGSPKGYVFLDINGKEYQVAYKASGMSKQKQMHLYTPDYLTWDKNFVTKNPTAGQSFYANIYLGSEQTNVTYRVDGGEWKAMQKVVEPDPFLKRTMLRQKLGILPTEGSRKLKRDYDNMGLCSHLWKANCPPGLSYGVHELEVRFTDPIIYNDSQRCGFIYLSPEYKEIDKELNTRYKEWVERQ
ncbi:MAG: calcineurin-like phosphoesterase C-terminal domain-containing protein [Bacteroidota bacterium]